MEMSLMFANLVKSFGINKLFGDDAQMIVDATNTLSEHYVLYSTIKNWFQSNYDKNHAGYITKSDLADIYRQAVASKWYNNRVAIRYNW